MRAGRLRHRVVIECKTVLATDEYGGKTERWDSIADPIAASVEPISGREFLTRDQRQAEVTSRIRVRSRSDVQQDMRVRWGDQVFDIKAVLDQQEQGREMHLMCSVGLSNG